MIISPAPSFVTVTSSSTPTIKYDTQDRTFRGTHTIQLIATLNPYNVQVNTPFSVTLIDPCIYTVVTTPETGPVVVSHSANET